MKSKLSQGGFGMIILAVIVVLALGTLVLWKWNWIKDFCAKTQAPYENSVEKPAWRTYQNEQYGFALEFPESWEGYHVSANAYSSYSYVGFSFRGENRQPFMIFQIVRYTPEQWRATGGHASQKILNESAEAILVCDGCCEEGGDS